MSNGYSREYVKERVRAEIPCTDYLTKAKHGQYCCPFCGSGTKGGADSDGALKYYPETNTWYCFACTESGDNIDLERQQSGLDYNGALSLMADKIGLTIAAPNGTERAQSASRPQGAPNTPAAAPSLQSAQETPTTADYTEYYKACRERLADPAAQAYLQQRGISPETAAAYWIGFDPAADPASAPGAMGSEYKPHPAPRLIIPTTPAHYIGRRTDGGETHKKLNSKGSKPGIFNSKALYAEGAQAVFVVEGAIDALSVIEGGAPSIALNSADNYKALLEKLTRRRSDALLILCPDNDPDERTAAKVKKCFNELAAGLQGLNIPFIGADICAGYKDPNEALTGNRAAFVQAIEDAQEAAKEKLREIRAAAEREEQERQQRTGAGMVDTFLETIRTRKYEPIPTGITDIDRALGGGFMRQWLVLLGAAPGAGKTALAQWIFEGMAKRGQSVLFLNLEMSREQILARSIARIAAQNGDKVKPTEILQGYQWTIEQEDAILTAAEAYKRDIAPRMVYNPDGVTADLDGILAYLETETERAQAAGNPAPLVVLDYLQIVTGKEREDDAAIIKRAVRGLKDYAIRNNTTVFVIIAHNRAANSSGNVTMESGRDTSALEYSADLQLGLAFTKCLKRNGKPGKSLDDLTPEERRFITLKVTKGRFATPGAEVDLYFNGETMTYSQTTADFEEQDAPPQYTAGYRL